MINDNKKKKITVTDHSDPPANPAPKKNNKIAVTIADDDGALQVPHEVSASAAAESAAPKDKQPATKPKSIAVNMLDDVPVGKSELAPELATETKAAEAGDNDSQATDTEPSPAADAESTGTGAPELLMDAGSPAAEPIGPPELPVDSAEDAEPAVAAPAAEADTKAGTSIRVLDANEDASTDHQASADLPESFTVVDATDDEAESTATADLTDATSADATAPLVPNQEPVAEPVPPRPSLSTSRPTIVPSAPDAAKPADTPLPDVFGDDTTAHAVDDILSKESDELLAAQDRRTARLTQPTPKHRKAFSLRSALRIPAVRWALAAVLVLGMGAVGAMPQTRYAVLNTVGVRAGASVRVVDESTQQPLKHVHVTLAGVTVDTDDEGNAQFQKLRLGKTTLTIEKRAFASVSEARTLGWGSNPLGERRVKPVGSQYDIVVTDFLSAKPVAAASITAGDADANADDKGQIKLTMEHSDASSFEAILKAPGYREEKITVTTDGKQQLHIKLVPDRKHLFVSQRSGKYDVYKADIDGKNEAVLLAGTGRERSDIALAAHPGANVAALVSTRDDKHNADGYALSTLTMINADDGSTQSVVQSEQISISGWVGDRLVYVQIVAGASAANPSRQRLMSYDYKTRDNKQLASANYFNDVLVANGKVYYAPSSAYQASNTNGLYRVNADGSNTQTIINQETWNLFRTDYSKISITIPNQWYEFAFDATSATKLDSQPTNTTSRVYMDSPDGKRSAWLDKRDGKGVLLIYDIDKKSDTVLQTQSGLTGPVRWLNNSSLVYRIHTEQETADYALSLDGGKPVKIRDVTPTGSVDRWYYY